MEAAIEAFLESRRIDRGASERTIEAYRRDLTQFSAWLAQGTRLEDIGLDQLNRFLAKLHRDRIQPASLARKASALRQFFKFCCLERGLGQNPAEQLESPAQAKRLPRFLDHGQVAALLAAAETGLPYPGKRAEALKTRDRAMVYLLYATGLRVSELVGLTTHDTDLELAYVKVRGKGEKERIVPFVPAARERLVTWLREHRLSLSPVTDHCFVSQRGLALTRQSFWKTLAALARAGGISVPLSPHMLRHSFATHLLQSGMNLRSLQMLLGHSDLATTQIYSHVTPEHLKIALRKFHPRGE